MVCQEPIELALALPDLAIQLWQLTVASPDFPALAQALPVRHMLSM